MDRERDRDRDLRCEKLVTVARSATSCMFKLEFPTCITGFEEQNHHADFLITPNSDWKEKKSSLMGNTPARLLL